ncbi:MAG: hypothetical protein ACFFCV_08810 [Promethearchaeota archaeon]
MTKKKEIEKINQIYDKENRMPIDSYIKLYTNVIREMSENLKQKTSILDIFITEENDPNKISDEVKINNHFKKLQNTSKM